VNVVWGFLALYILAMLWWIVKGREDE